MSKSDTNPERTFLFGPFRLSTSRRALFEGDHVVRLGSKAIEILIALVERAGELVDKRELVEIAWPDTHVVEANLTVQVATLRRALGEDEVANQYIVNSPGRGYRFVAPIRVLSEDDPDANEPLARERHNLPAQLTRLIGRTETLQAIALKLSDERLLSIVGPPGVGKTALALRVAEAMMPQFQHGVWLVDLGSITNASAIPSAIASALPIEVRSSDILSGIAAALRYKNLLFVFDNCEHLIDDAASAISALLHGAGGVKVIATSREPLRIEGEDVWRLAPLDTPPTDAGSENVMTYPAVQLFVERAAAIVNDFKLTETDANFAAQICRGLDGNPLAIEVTAARVDTFGVKGLASRIQDRMHLLADTHRGTPARHRTIAAALEWSYQLLCEREQYILRCLSIFAGSFTLKAAIAIIPESCIDDPAPIIADLVCKSLLSVEIGSDDMRFRLLEITKAFALTKLIEKSEREAPTLRLASYLTTILRECAESRDRTRSLQTAIHELDNVRGVLNWAFAPGGNLRAGVELTTHAVPAWLENSLLRECIGWTGKAIDALDSTEEVGGRSEMILKAALGLATMFTEGMTGQAKNALNRSIELAVDLNDEPWQLRAQLGLIVFFHRRGDLRSALAATKTIENSSAGISDPMAAAMTKSVKSASLFFSAEYPEAMKLAREAHEYFRTHSDAPQIGRWGLNHSVYAQCVIARTLWNQGHFDRTIQACLSAHAEAEESGNPTSVCQALSWCGGSLFLKLGELDRADEAIKRLKQVAQDGDFQSYFFSAMGFEGRLLFLRGEIALAERLLREALSKLGDLQYENVYIPFLGRLAELLATDGRAEEAFLASAEALERTKVTGALWLLPDSLRIHGDVLASLEGSDSKSAEAHLREAINIAVKQGSLGWELQSAESLTNFLVRQHRTSEAITILERTLEKFSDQSGIRAYRRATTLLEELQDRNS